MTWNYRVACRKGDAALGVEDMYGIYETYYNLRGHVKATTENPISITGSDMKELKQVYNQIGKAFHDPVLDYQTRKPIPTRIKKGKPCPRKTRKSETK